MTDPFALQRRVDEFRGGLGNLGGRLERHAGVDAILETADRYGWHPRRLGQVVAVTLRNHEHPGPGLVLRVAQDLAGSPEPVRPTDHQLDAHRRAKAGTFHQPKPPCGRCDGGPGRWLEVTPEGGHLTVVHCPNCWTQPPGYVPPRERGRPDYL